MKTNNTFIINELSLEKQLVKSPHWVWKKRMRTNFGIIVEIICQLSKKNQSTQSELMIFDDMTKDVFFKSVLNDPILPDLNDKNTLEIVLNLIRDKRCDDKWCPVEIFHDTSSDWVIEKPSNERQTLYGSYVSALVAAFLK